jgi:hypothetical protein
VSKSVKVARQFWVQAIRDRLASANPFAHLRTPPKPLALEWADVNRERDRFRVVPPRTEHQDGGERRVPTLPELRPDLQEAVATALTSAGLRRLAL